MRLRVLHRKPEGQAKTLMMIPSAFSAEATLEPLALAPGRLATDAV